MLNLFIFREAAPTHPRELYVAAKHILKDTLSQKSLAQYTYLSPAVTGAHRNNLVAGSRQGPEQIRFWTRSGSTVNPWTGLPNMRFDLLRLGEIPVGLLAEATMASIKNLLQTQKTSSS
jgi:hypothetical protein